MRVRGNTVNVRLGEERATSMQTARERGVWSAVSEGEIQTQTSVEQRWPEWSVISGRMDLTQR